MVPEWIETDARKFGVALAYGLALDPQWLYSELIALYNERADPELLKSQIALRLALRFASLANGKSDEYAQAMLDAVFTSVAGVCDGRYRTWQIAPATYAALRALGEQVRIARALPEDDPLPDRFVNLLAFQSRWSSMEPRDEIRALIVRIAEEAMRVEESV